MANGYVRYGNSIHLDGFQILDFCIENAISLESLRDLNLGRKVFLTGNDTNAGYLRENVWDGTRWRTAAYLDDIDKITNGEGSLGTRVKALEDMLKMDDASDAINTWAEIQKFLENIDEGLDLMTMLDGKLDKTGGTITGMLTSNGRIILKSFLQFNQYNADAEYLLGMTDNNGILRWYNGSSWNTIIHSGNVGDFALKTDGSNAMTGDLQLLTMGSGSVNVAVTEGLFIYRGPSSGGTDAGLPGNYINVFNVGGANAYSNLQLAWRRDYLNPTLYARIGESSAYSDWKTIAFTDSTVEAANRLANKVSLWGNEFDGTQSLNGRIAFNKGFAAMVVPIEDGGSNIEFLYVNPDGHLLLGQGLARKEKNTLIYGNNIKFCYGTVGTLANTAMTITEEGNVLVGVASQTNTDFKFEVSGLSRIYTTGQSMSLGKVPTSGLVFGAQSSLQGQIYFDYSGSLCLQGQNVSDSTVRALNLNPLGGAVNVGSGGLKMAGYANFNSNGDGIGIIGRSIYLHSNGTYATSDTVEFTPEYTSFRTRLSPATHNSYSLGSSSYRWSNVYSVGGNFSGRVLIGGAEDDADYALNVKGDSYFGGTVYIPSGQKLTIGSVTFEEDAAGRVKVDGDMYTTGTLASGGKAKEGTGTGSGSANVRDFELPADRKTTYDCDHLLKSKNVIVQVFEKAIQNNIEVWEMILTDVTIVTEDRVTVTFGRPTTRVHKVHIIGGNVS